MNPGTRYTLRRNSASIMKVRKKLCRTGRRVSVNVPMFSQLAITDSLDQILHNLMRNFRGSANLTCSRRCAGLYISGGSRGGDGGSLPLYGGQCMGRGSVGASNLCSAMIRTRHQSKTHSTNT